MLQIVDPCSNFSVSSPLLCTRTSPWPWAYLWKTTGVAVTKPIPSVPSASHFIRIIKILSIVYHVHTWQVSKQLGCGDTCLIWSWLNGFKRNICEIKISLTENRRSSSRPQAVSLGPCRRSEPWLTDPSIKREWHESVSEWAELCAE